MLDVYNLFYLLHFLKKLSFIFRYTLINLNILNRKFVGLIYLNSLKVKPITYLKYSHSDRHFKV